MMMKSYTTKSASLAFLFTSYLCLVSDAFVHKNTNIRAARRTQSSQPSLYAQKYATFGMGCFWKPAETLLKIDGVIDTAAGYTGNPSATETPNYDSVCFSRDWVEGVRVTYDDDKVSYQELLDAFFAAQQPKTSRQYDSIIFPHDEEQKQVAQSWLKEGTASKRVRDDGVPVSFTKLEPLSSFYSAEGYHQDYWPKFRARFAAVAFGILLLTAPLDTALGVSPDVVSNIRMGTDLALKAVAVYVILERVLDSKVEEL